MNEEDARLARKARANDDDNMYVAFRLADGRLATVDDDGVVRLAFPSREVLGSIDDE